jgi:hypothetical protein
LQAKPPSSHCFCRSSCGLQAKAQQQRRPCMWRSIAAKRVGCSLLRIVSAR